MITVDSGSPDVQKELIKILDKEDIEYHEIDRTTIKVKDENIQEVVLYVNRVTNSIVPLDRSVALPQPNQKEFIDLLDESGLGYRTVQYGGQDWIVWGDEDHEEVLRLLDVASEATCCPQ